MQLEIDDLVVKRAMHLWPRMNAMRAIEACVNAYAIVAVSTSGTLSENDDATEYTMDEKMVDRFLRMK